MPQCIAQGKANQERKGAGMYTSLGYHTFAISKALTKEEAGILFEEFKKYRDRTEEICIMNPKKYERDPLGRHFDIVYPGQNKGLSWKIRFCNRGHIIDGEFKPCSIKAVINPKVLVKEEKSYIIAANAGYLRDVEEIFDYEARKISPRLAGFCQYSLNRTDYCVNFDISELKFNRPISRELKRRLPELIMTLIKCGDIPNRFKEEFSENERCQFYLRSKAVVINCYWKREDLQRNFRDCKDIEKSYDIIRFEVQFKYPKVFTKVSGIKKKRDSEKEILEEKMREQGFEDFIDAQDELNDMEQKRLNEMYRNSTRLNSVAVMETMLSDEMCGVTIENYFCKVVRRGDYYTFDAAKKKIELQGFKQKKIARLTRVLQMVHNFGGIAKAKAAFGDGEDEELEEFRWSLRDLDNLRINPVTIPEEWGIAHIPNLLENYFELRAEEQRKIQEEKDNEQLLKDYIKDCKKRKKMNIVSSNLI